MKNTIEKMKVELNYYKGANYCNGRKRGYSLYINKVEVEQEDGYNIEKSLPLRATSIFLLEVTRKSKKAENQAREMVLDHIDYYLELIKSRYDFVISKEDFEEMI